MAAPVYIPTIIVWGFFFFTPFPSFIYGLFDVDPSDECEMISQGSFDFHFFNN